VLDALVAAAFLGAGAGLWRQPLVGPAALSVGTALAWLLGDLSGALVFTHRGPLLHLLLAYPGGLPRRRATRAVVAAGYVDALVYPVGHADVATAALVAIAVAVAGLGYFRSSGLERRARRVPSLAMVAVGAVLAVGAVARLADHPVDRGVLQTYQLVLIGGAIALYADAQWGRWPRAALAGLVVDLGNAIAPTPLRDKLAAALADPSLVVGYPAPGGYGLVDEAGRLLPRLPDQPTQTVTTVRDGDRILAVLVHNASVPTEPRLLDSVAALARVAVANIELRADILRTITELEESRRRLLAVGDAERERLAEQLAAGALARLDRASAMLADDDLRREAEECRKALVDFARGIHPRTLTQHGLAPALSELVAGAPVPVTLDVDLPRVTPPVETAAYFVCAEALTNIVKYAPESAVTIRARIADDALQIEVRDDGCGDADPARGSGLRGLADRVDVLGGSLTVVSPPGGGTRVSAVLPITSAAHPRGADSAY
jgi:signal transduction histidine kinase